MSAPSPEGQTRGRRYTCGYQQNPSPLAQQFTQVPARERGSRSVARETKGGSCPRNAALSRAGPAGWGGGGGVTAGTPGSERCRGVFVLPTCLASAILAEDRLHCAKCHQKITRAGEDVLQSASVRSGFLSPVGGAGPLTRTLACPSPLGMTQKSQGRLDCRQHPREKKTGE